MPPPARYGSENGHLHRYFPRWKDAGTNLELYKELSQIEGLDIVASGGISSLKEIEILKNEVYGAILGKALYLGAIDLKEALKYSV